MNKAKVIPAILALVCWVLLRHSCFSGSELRNATDMSIADHPSDEIVLSVDSLTDTELGLAVSDQMLLGFQRSTVAFHDGVNSIFGQIVQGISNLATRNDVLEQKHIQKQRKRQQIMNSAIENTFQNWNRAGLVRRLQLEGTRTRTSLVALNYIEQYYPIAARLYIEYGVPVSITLSQGLVESAAGTSDLAVNANNHFGMKCGCPGGIDEYYSRDDEYVNGKLVKSCFDVYESVEESYLQHARLLCNQRYGWIWGTFSDHGVSYRAHNDWLNKSQVNYYQAMAIAIKLSGYATSPTYHATLIATIERYDLWKLDKIPKFVE